MAQGTTNYNLQKPVDGDMADLKVFVGQNMDTIDTELAKRIVRDATTGKIAPIDLPIMSGSNVGTAQVGNGLAMSGNYLYIKSGTGLAINTAGDYSLYVKPATTTTLGGVMVGSGLSIDANGLLTSTGGGGGGASVIDAVGNYSLSTNSAFSASSSASQTMGAGAIVKLIFGTEQFDTQAEYDPTTGRFTAKESGIYFFSACMRLNSTAATQIFLAFYKNGVADTRVQQFMNGAGSPTATTNTSAPAQAHGNNIMKLNAGDYIEVYGYTSVASSTQGLEALAFDTTFFRGTKLS